MTYFENLTLISGYLKTTGKNNEQLFPSPAALVLLLAVKDCHPLYCSNINIAIHT